MIAPEGIRDGQHYAEALYTFAGEGVEDLPFKKGDMIEVLDCADANWWRGKNLSTDEDGLFPACLVKFTNAPVHQEAMKTTERLARLSDVLTPSYMKPQNGSTDSNGAQQDQGRGDTNSIEALLLNLADNEMQVQQQKVQAHMPRKPTRMKLLYEDHTNPGSAGRTNSTSKPKDTGAQKRQEAAGSSSATNPNATGSWAELPVPNFQKKKSQPQVDASLSQAGIWGAPSSRTSNASNSNPQLFGSTTSFTSSLESMRDATQRSEEASRNRSSGSMLFGPRVMPTSRSSSRTQQNASASIHSEKNTMRLNDVLSTLDSNPSLSSLYSASDRDDTISRESHAAHQQAITEARQLMDGIPSPTEFGSGGDSHNRHEAEYLFSDNESDVEASVADSSKLQAMMSPSSENSARFVSYSSTVSSQTSEVSEPGRSKRLPVIPSSANLSLVSDTSSVGLAGHNSSAGDLAHLHRSWYSSTESLNLMGGGGVSIKSPVAEAFNTEDVDGQHDTHAPRMTKQKSRIRPTEGSLRASQTDTLSTAYLTSLGAPNEDSQQQQQQHSYDAGRRDVPNEGVSNFQHMVNMSANAQSGYSGVSRAAATVAAADMRPVVTGANSQYPGYVATNGGVVQYHQQHPATNGGVVTPVQQTMQPNALLYQPADAHSNMAAGGAYGQQGYGVYGGYGAGVDGSVGYTSGSPGTAMYAPTGGQMQEGYAQLGVPLSVGPTYSQQPQTQVVGAVMTQGQTGRLSPAGPYALDVSGSSAVTPPVISAATVGARPRSYTAGASVADGMTGGHLAHAPAVQQPLYQQQTSQLRPSVSAGGLADAGGETDVRSRLAQNDVRRPVSFGGTGSVADTRAATPESAQSSVRSSAAFGTVSSAPTLSGAQRDGRMSPFPSNVGAAQTPSPSLSGATVTGADTLKAAAPTATADELDAQLLLPLPENITPINYVKMARPVFKFGGRISRPETMGWGRVDRQMAMLKTVSAKLTVEALATMHVGRPFNKPIERIRAAFVWIASNVQYDGSVAESNDEFERNEAPGAVLQRRRSRGPGFAYLFDAMMRALGIESHAIRGYLRQPLDTCRGPVLPAANHVWNVVCLDGEYRIVDSASAAKSHPLNAECKVDSWFFLASPKEAIFTHFPLAPEDQFIDPIVTLPIFWMLPYVRPAYFQTRAKLLNLPLMPRIELKDDQVVPLVLCVRDSALAVFAEIELHDPNGSGRIVARQPLLAQCMDYKGRRMVKVLVGVRAGDARGLLKIYCGPRASQNQQQSPGQGENQPSGAARAHKVLGFLHGKERRASAHDYSRVQGVDEDGRIRAVASAKSYPLACALHVTHRGRSNAPLFVQPSAAAPNEFYIKEPTSAQLHLGESVGFHLLPVGDQRLFHVQLRSPGGQQHKFVYQPSDQGYVLRHAVKERGAWIIVYHSDAEGWLPIASYQCV